MRCMPTDWLMVIEMLHAPVVRKRLGVLRKPKKPRSGCECEQRAHIMKVLWASIVVQERA